MGWAHYRSGEFVDALTNLVAAQRTAEKIGDQALAAHVMDRIACVYRSTARASLALELQQRSLALFHEMGDLAGEATVLSNMARTFVELGRQEEALDSAFGALRFAESSEDPRMLMDAFDTLAEVYLTMNDLDEAAKYVAQGLSLARSRHSEIEEGEACLTIARIELRRERVDEALTAAQSALSIAEKHGLSMAELACHELLTRIHERRGDVPETLAHFRRFYELDLARAHEEMRSRLSDLQAGHEAENARKDAEIDRLRALALGREVEQNRVVEAQLEAQSALDPLTNLLDRRHFSVLAEDLDHDLEQGNPASIMLFDLDRLREINDIHGHFAGDRTLATISRLLRDNARGSDTPIRYGDDEFLVVLGGTDSSNSRIIAERLRSTVAETRVEYRGMSIPLSVSVGVASASPGDECDLPGLVAHADRALHAAKRAGRNCVVMDTSLTPDATTSSSASS
jgi:diguanylate cyclase (GGDEF)-like protein